MTMPQPNPVEAAPDFGGVQALVVGDAMLDRYILGSVRRVSPEAPVPVVSLQREWDCPGGAANVAASVAALGARVTFAGLLGRDEYGARLRRCLAEFGYLQLRLLEPPGLTTIAKTRILAADQHQLLRLDADGHKAAFEQAAEELAASLVPAVRGHQVMCLADYDKGTLAPGLLRTLIEEARRCGVPCLIDPKKADFAVYAGATVLTPNVFETERALARPLGSDSAVAEAAAELRDRLGLDYMLITRGAEGMTLAGPGGAEHLPAQVRAVADVTGAGDTVVAALACCLARGWDMATACRLAGVAAGVAVSKPGVYVVRAAELGRAWQGGSTKVLDWDTARDRLAEARRRGRKAVFTNGCFDILHSGHLHCLEQSRRLGDLLVVGLNSDASVKLNKGPTRPVIDETHRAAMLAGLACVDLVVLFEDLTPERLIRHLEPDVLVKGGDYDPATMAGADFVRSKGGAVVTVPLLEEFSTTSILEKLKTRNP
jgi:D-beta-D-heptose 7-phosphate kinase/D-beta-D-heptose 1-phosphate adenosyltransferase